MNLKKLAILLGITALCSFADATATVNVNGVQTSVLKVNTPEIQTASGTGGGASISVTGGTGSASSAGTSQVTIIGSTPTTKVATDNKNQGSYNVNVNAP